MTFGLTDDQTMIRETAATLFAQEAHADRVRAVASAGTGHDPALWSMVAKDLGWCALPVPGGYCGLDLGPVESVILLEAAGQRLAPVPLWSTIGWAVPLLLQVATAEACGGLLPAVAAGDRILAVAPGGITARHGRGGYLLSGRTGPVIDLGVADTVLVQAQLEDTSALFVLERGRGAQVRPLVPLDATRSLGELVLDDLPVGQASRIDRNGVSPEQWSAALGVAQVTLAAEQIGAARGAMDMTLAYIAERVQFGRTIASFQAIKHRCARLEVDFAEARAMVYGVAAGLQASGAEEGLLEAHGARALATDLLFRAAEESIQMHGGVGFTLDYDPHLYLKRAQATASLLGRPDEHLERIARHLLGEGRAS